MSTEVEKLRRRVHELEETLAAIQHGEVDAIVIQEETTGEQIYTLKRADEGFRTLVEAMGDGAVLLDYDGLIIYSNPAMALTTGYPSERIAGSRLEDLLLEGHTLPMVMRTARKTGCVARDFKLRRADDRWLSVHCTVTPLQVEEERPLTAVVFVDMSIVERTESLVASERLARGVMEQSGEGILVCDRDKLILRSNDAARKLCRTEPESLPLTEALFLGLDGREPGPADSEELLRRLEEVLTRSRAKLSVEATVIGADEQIHNLLLSGTPLNDDRGTVLGCILVLTDITEKKLRERVLFKNQEKLARTLKAANVGLWEWDLHTNKVFYSPEWKLQLGYGDDEIGNDFSEWQSRVHPDDLSGILEKLQHYLDKPWENYSSEVRLRHKDGSYRWILAIASLVYDEDGRPLRMLGSHIDITQRKQAEIALQDSQKKLETTLTAAPIGIGLIKNRVIQSVNQEFKTMLGYTDAELIGKNARFLYESDEEFQRVGEVKYAQIREFGTGEVDTRLKCKSGAVLDIHLRSTAINRTDFSEGVIFAAVDISERKRNEVERERLHRELGQALKMEALGQLTGGIAHDFNNILGIVKGYSELARDQSTYKEEHKTAEYLGNVLKAVERAKLLIKKMLVFSGADFQTVEPHQLQILFNDEVNLLRSILPSSIEIKIESKKDLPMVSVNQTDLNQLLMNLCANARDSMGGKGELCIRLGWTTALNTECSACHSKVTGDWVELSVTDTGNGIESEALNRIFDPYYTTKEVGKGTGMGLAIIQGIMRKHGGHVLVDTNLKKGTTFRLLFPPIAETKEAEPAEHCSITEEILRGNGEQILVVDDEPDLADIFVSMLESQGYNSTMLTNSREALERIKRDPDEFALLITDQTMPEMTGKELALESRNVKPDLPVVLITGYSDQIDEEAAGVLGIRYLEKPVDQESLLKVVGELLQCN